jgi:hypothetical protein
MTKANLKTTERCICGKCQKVRQPLHKVFVLLLSHQIILLLLLSSKIRIELSGGIVQVGARNVSPECPVRLWKPWNIQGEPRDLSIFIMARQPLLGLGIHYEVFLITLRHTTVGRIPLNEWSVFRRDLYLTLHTPHTKDRDPWLRRDSNSQATGDPRLRPRGHWHRLPGKLTARKSDRGMTSTIQLHLVWSVRISGYVRLLALYASLRKQRKLYFLQCRCLNKTQRVLILYHLCTFVLLGSFRCSYNMDVMLC